MVVGYHHFRKPPSKPWRMQGLTKPQDLGIGRIIDIRMLSACTLTVGSPDLLLRAAGFHTQHGVGIFRHLGQPPKFRKALEAKNLS